MCGIAGFIGDIENKDTVLKDMCDRIQHRGPDGQGYYINGNVALGQRRLSIIDIDGGAQPMFSKDGHLVVVYNGEIYNYKELKDELGDYPWQTNSDTEVLLYGYQQWGKDLPKHLRGMFAFAIYDTQNETLFCARDNFGIKPFYYYQNEDVFMFASEIKAFLDHPSFKKEINDELLSAYMSFSFTPTIDTFFKGVKRLDAGHSLTYTGGQIQIDKYYDIEFDIKHQNYDEVVSQIEKTMTESVQYHMISDVEVGSFLSSGIDSSYLVSLARPDKTYTVGYDIPRYNEIEYAENLTEKLGITNQSKKINKEEYMDILDKVLYHMDEPASDPAIISLYFVAQLAAQDVKVVLSGEGADEFFGGYNYYREEVDYAFYNKIPFCIRHLISKICSKLPPVRGINFLVRRGEKLEDSYIGVNKVWNDNELKKLLKKPITLHNKDITKPIYDNLKGQSDIVKMQTIDIYFWLMKDILQKADRMTMANSLEGRVPFIDKYVFKMAASLPLDYKVTKENTKVALRDAAKKTIPTEAYKKKKLGFPVPIRDWMKEDDVYNEIKEAFNSDVAQTYFDTNILLKMLDEHKNNKKDNYRKIWNAFCFIRWYKVFFEDSAYC
ncbi:MAG: asparagine synthase (glutamine-hydrolyzing) [Erysipelotrichaceae bacterium]|nr:asparagine synthase (glutamine-hydrolyzing) [Erysipelotrichaceae bacterium]